MSSKRARAARWVSFWAPRRRSSTSAWGLSPADAAAADGLHADGFEGFAAEAGDDPAGDVGREVVGLGEGEGVVEAAGDGVLGAAGVDEGAFAAGDLDDGGVDVEAAEGLGEAVVVGEDDDLSVLAGGLEDAGEAVHAGGVHGLDGVVDDDEAEGALGEGGPGDEEAEGEGVELALAHDAEGGALLAVDGDVELDLAGLAGAAEVDVLQGDVALEAELVPDAPGLVGDGGEALVAEGGVGAFEPLLGGLEVTRWREAVLDTLSPGVREYTLTGFWNSILLTELARKIADDQISWAQLTSRTTKTGTERTVEIAGPLAAYLEKLQAQRRKVAFRSGVEPMGERVVFPELASHPPERAYRRPRQVMRRVLKRAGLPGHFTFHSTRHTFCSLLMASGVSPVYVQQQAGHEEVGFTVRVYSSWLPVEQPGAMDALAEGVPVTQPVTNRGSTGKRVPGVSPQALAPRGATHPRARRGPRTP
jgi:hypothetical protein